MSCYATSAQFDRWGIRPSALPASITDADKVAAVEAASSVADGYLGRFRLPLSSWGDDLRQRVCEVAAYKLLSSQVGFNPELGHNQTVLVNHDAAVRWFEQVSFGHVTPAGIVDTAPAVVSTSRATSNPKRGW